ncbi:hypothetical protein NT2_10_00760 [Caenibius tardaugens NBRC 16725]|uniref:2'-5' RNA ligase family protein n=1 Tax=Caenibius tardaugens NBRC 16725 TaxID=1219035 RepID=U2YB09_9SPHN|nr:hypothetical protein [Caenibius tardaugens]AZI35804.1 hypothetical protein EGO55_07290 [Caenibius tardaugens NBRC 16725]GAD50631.1 hypothetical protein NT2_10_00760 [Caenibius tardaugens NBRC 16725]
MPHTLSRQTKLHVMIKVPPMQRADCVACRDAHGVSPHFGANRYHCTMLPLGLWATWTDERVAHLIAALGRFDVEPFRMEFDQIGPGQGNGVALKPRAGLRGAGAFHRALCDHLLRAGVVWEQPDTYKFRLHIHLAYRGPHRGWAGTTVPIDPIGWLADEFQLVHSIDGEQRHEVLGRWPMVRRQYIFPFAA